MKKTWVPLLRLSHVRALACLAQDKQLETAHAVRYDNPRAVAMATVDGVSYTQRGRSVAYLLSFDLRDLHVEDNVRKRPFLPVK